MNDMIVKNVDVLGDAIMATKDKDGNIWAGVSYFCNALGMSRGQKNRQVKNAQEDEVLKQGCIKLGAGVLDAGNEAVALRIDFIPIWLAKIVITEKTKKQHPELADKLLEYQLKAKDILAEAFMPKKTNELMTTQEQIQLLAQGNVELNEKIDKVKEAVNEVKVDVEALKNDLPILPVEADSIVLEVKKRGVEILGGKQSAAYKDKSVRQRVYNDLYHDLKRQFNCRTYKAIRRGDVDKAIGIAEAYVPPLFLKEQIEELNGGA